MEADGDAEEGMTVLETAELKLKDLGVPYSAAAPADSFPPLAARVLAARAALGGLGELPPLPPAPAAADVLHFASALGLPFTLEPAASEGDRCAALLDFMASELQALRFALAVRRREARAAEAIARSASLETELHSLLRALSIPPLRGDTAAKHPEKVLAQVRAGGGGRKRELGRAPPPLALRFPPLHTHTHTSNTLALLPLHFPPLRARSRPRWSPWRSGCPRAFSTSARCWSPARPARRGCRCWGR